MATQVWEIKDSGSSQPQQLPQQTKHRPRQSPGAACEECRRRKLRCDRKTPQCGVCASTGVVCKFNPLRTRGAKKKNLQQLQQRMTALEERLTITPEHNLVFPDRLLDLANNATTTDIAKLTSAPTAPEALSASTTSLDFHLPPSGPQPAGSDIPVLIREELDQLYFDRVHLFAPMIHQSRYVRWSQQRTKNEAKEALQYAMWTLAASSSAQFQQLAQALYDETRRMLDVLEVKGREIDTTDIEHLQACLLLATYEFIHSYDRRSWMRAGYAFRLVQLMRLFELDSPTSGLASFDWIELEEKRRTFWVAFCLDRFLSIRNRWPITLIEHLITTRLPAPESAFQSGQPVGMEYLADAISSNGPVLVSPFSELVIIATVCGRALVHHYQALVESNYNNSIRNFHDRHQWIHSTLIQRLDILAGTTSGMTEINNPVTLFTRMLGQTTILYLHHTLELSAYDFDTLEIASVIEYDEIALRAAQEMVSLTKMLSQPNSFKIHPFTPIPLSLCVDFFNASRDPTTTFYTKLQEIFQALQNVKVVNGLGGKILGILESSRRHTQGSQNSSSAMAIGNTPAYQS
ncbi:fungal-specific transcription factor domain-containing protein [Aspergillus pseudoustus]|uniref:Fungal-specific transcription factor domain-containing protein n=1 Tax=Aspergillus pseudoustus TaxID=1810923 RepID=A0ABR4JZK5_9EURO